MSSKIPGVESGILFSGIEEDSIKRIHIPTNNFAPSATGLFWSDRSWACFVIRLDNRRYEAIGTQCLRHVCFFFWTRDYNDCLDKWTRHMTWSTYIYYPTCLEDRKLPLLSLHTCYTRYFGLHCISICITMEWCSTTCVKKNERNIDIRPKQRKMKVWLGCHCHPTSTDTHLVISERKGLILARFLSKAN